MHVTIITSVLSVAQHDTAAIAGCMVWFKGLGFVWLWFRVYMVYSETHGVQLLALYTL